jgi:radical SAM superfamily enzyme YgiQ (UPF0313 family)
MSDILLAAVNARFNHTNIAVRSIALYTAKPELVSFGEWTINQSVQDILRGIASYHPTIIMFSTYIWNIEVTLKVIRELPKILPGCVVCAGGPEAGFRAEQILTQEHALSIVITGEGEQTCADLARLYESQRNPFSASSYTDAAASLPGVYARTSQGKIVCGGQRALIQDMSMLPFPYPVIDDPDNRIYYYESSRGCPFSCAYCMSSLDTRVRFMPLQRVYSDLQKFLDARVKLVKFVDRTYNLDEDRYIAIWRYILEHHNGKTMFHFEIEAEYLSDAALDFIRQVPEGVMQFEIGVQSSNPEVLKAVHRSPDIVKLSENVRRIPKTIHKHLDLIAGLPLENTASFGRSFDTVISLDPDALQLGFLKVLYGTAMESYCRDNGWQWMADPPYEVLSTPYMSYEDILFLKDTEILLDAFWNSHGFDTVMHYLQRSRSMWEFFSALAGYCREHRVFDLPRSPLFWYGMLFEYEHDDTVRELIRFDFIRTGKKGSFPSWCTHRYSKDAHREALETRIDFHSTRTAYSYSEYDVFSINPLAPEKSADGKDYPVLFLYPQTPGGKTDTILL